MKKTYLDALMSIFTPIPLNNGFILWITTGRLIGFCRIYSF